MRSFSILCTRVDLVVSCNRTHRHPTSSTRWRSSTAKNIVNHCHSLCNLILSHRVKKMTLYGNTPFSWRALKNMVQPDRPGKTLFFKGPSETGKEKLVFLQPSGNQIPIPIEREERLYGKTYNDLGTSFYGSGWVCRWERGARPRFPSCLAAVSFPRRRKVFPRQDQSHNLSNFRLVISSAVIADADDAPCESTKSIKSDVHEENFATLLAAFWAFMNSWITIFPTKVVPISHNRIDATDFTFNAFGLLMVSTTKTF